MRPKFKTYTYSKYYFKIAKLNASGVPWKKRKLGRAPEE